MRRNLYFFIYPLKPSVWRHSIQRLLARWTIFNGRKVVAVAEDERTEKADLVKAAFGKSDVEILVVRNNPNLGETVAFIEGLSMVESKNPDEATFYAHAKGQRWDGKIVDAILRWTDAMFFMNLECPALVDRLLLKYSSMGCFKIGGMHGGGSWHYSGSFYWLRHDALFSKNWRDIEMSFYGTEGYPGKMFRADETFALTPTFHPWQLYTIPPEKVMCRQWLTDLVREHVGPSHGKICKNGAHVKL